VEQHAEIPGWRDVRTTRHKDTIQVRTAGSPVINDAKRTLQTIIRWGRYAESFTYDDEKRAFNLNHSSP